MVPILHGSLLNYMTVITKVGSSYIDHMNDDTPKVNSISLQCYQALSVPLFEEITRLFMAYILNNICWCELKGILSIKAVHIKCLV